MWSEVRLVRQRINNRAIQDALTMQAVIADALSSKGRKPLEKLLKRIENSD